MKIDIGIATSKQQSPSWWLSIFGLLLRAQRAGIEIGQMLAIGTAMPDATRNLIVNNWFIKPDLTSENRNEIVAGHESGDAAGILWFDDDTIPPPGTIERLVALDADIAAGLYVRRAPPYDPLAFHRLPNGAYQSILDFQYGEIKSIDSVGMGCTYVHRYVYDEIREQHVLFRREATNSLIAFHRSQVSNVEALPREMTGLRGRAVVSNQGMYHVEILAPLLKPPGRWPYYVMEHIRTEDHHFCELAKNCGFVIKVDTGIECGHIGERNITPDDFRELRAMLSGGAL